MNTNKQTQWITLRSFSTPIEAHLALSVLESEGIEGFVRDEFTIALRPYLAPALGGVRLDVHPQDAERARALLDAPAAEPEPKRCPRCGGEGGPAPDAAGRLAAVLATLFTMVPARMLREKHRCVACGHEWRC
jgi:hypothetical protein